MVLSFEKYVQENLVPVASSHAGPNVLLLTCMDYRYAHRIVDVMDQRGLRGQYDIFVLAGAAAGANHDAKWKEALISHIRVARAVPLSHPIDRIVILEHRDCGAYKVFNNLYWDQVTPPKEESVHKQEVDSLIAYLKREFATEIPTLKIDALLLAREQDDELRIESTT